MLLVIVIGYCYWLLLLVIVIGYCYWLLLVLIVIAYCYCLLLLLIVIAYCYCLLLLHTVIVILPDFDPDLVYVPKVGRTRNAIICQSKTERLQCDNSSLVLVIYAATYGRLNEGRVVCPYDGGSEWTSDDACEVDVETVLRALCDKRKKCKIRVSPTLLGNPCPAVNKYLHIIYGCGKNICLTFNEAKVSIL